MQLNIFCATTPFTKKQNQQKRRYNYSIILQGDIIITQFHHKTAKFNFIAKKKEKPEDFFFLFGRGGRNRTLLWSFGDSHSTDELHP